MKIPSIFCAMRLLLVCAVSHGANSDPLTGSWRVKSLLDSAPITATGDKQAKLLIGKRLIFNESSVRLGKDVCTQPEFTMSEEKTFEAFYDGYRTDPVNLRLPETVTAVNVKCKNRSEIAIFYVANKNRIVFYWLGFFFDAVRVGR